MVDFDRAAALAKRLVEGAGRSVVFFKENRTPANSSQPWNGPSTAAAPASGLGGASVTAIACFVPASGSGFGRSASGRDNVALKDVEQFALVASTSLPANTDLAQFNAIRDGTSILRIHTCQELNPGSTSVMWEVGVSK